MPLHQYDYIFAIGTIFAFLDAWNIGANDVANSWATSISSRSVTYIQGACLASIMEFIGAVGAGSRVSDTIRTKIVDTSEFKNDAPLLMLGMLCAVIASSLFLTWATKIGFPVSTTHSILGGVLGMGIAAVGADGIQWVKYKNGAFQAKDGVVTVFLAWIVAPCISAGFASVIFMITKFGILLRNNPVMKGFVTIPLYFGITAALLAMLVVTKGGQIDTSMYSEGEIAAIICGVGAGWMFLISLFLLPWMYRVVIKDDWQLRWWHIPLGPLLLKRGEIPPPPTDSGHITDFYEGRLTLEELEARRAAANGDVEAAAAAESKEANITSSSDSDSSEPPLIKYKPLVGPKPEGGFSGALVFWYVKWLFLRGVDQDVLNMQKKQGALSGDIEETHARASHFDNKTEYLFSFLQIMTACTASFTHGANDVANAIGPYATIYEIWDEGTLPPKGKSQVPTWILAFGGVAIVIGLWTYGYNIMRNLGNRLTLQSPVRGFSMELGSAITVILATKLNLPISTTQCITGATVGVGLCNGDWRAINWRMVAWIYLGWVITLPVAGIMSGCLMGFIINAPRWGMSS